MNENLSVDIGLLENRAFIIGRDGHIYLDSPTVSKQHAEIKISNGRVFLRDLHSTNGTYLLKNNRLVLFESGYVDPLQSIFLGDQAYTIMSLLAIANDFAVTNADDYPTQLNLPKQAVNS